ncbi:MAG: hypothetical protein ACXW32_05115 [Limisphaerales bacterium]
MRILLDECVPEQVRKAFTNDSVATVKEMGWRGLKNGKLLREIERAGFDLFIVADKNMRFQQKLDHFSFAILELWTNHRPTLETHLGHIGTAAQRVQPGDYVTVLPP